MFCVHRSAIRVHESTHIFLVKYYGLVGISSWRVIPFPFDLELKQIGLSDILSL